MTKAQPPPPSRRAKRSESTDLVLSEEGESRDGRRDQERSREGGRRETRGRRARSDRSHRIRRPERAPTIRRPRAEQAAGSGGLGEVQWTPLLERPRDPGRGSGVCGRREVPQHGPASRCSIRLRRNARPSETRAITPAPGTVGVTMHPTLPGVFLPMAAQALRVDMPRVGAGTQAYPVVSTDVTAGARDKGKAGPETAGAITVTTVDFKRVTGSFRLAIEDLQKLPSLSQTLRANLGSVLSDAVDGMIVNGVTAANNVVSAVPGFFSDAEPVVAAAADEANADTLADYITEGAGPTGREICPDDGRLYRSWPRRKWCLRWPARRDEHAGQGLRLSPGHDASVTATDGSRRQRQRVAGHGRFGTRSGAGGRRADLGGLHDPRTDFRTRTRARPL